jgi:hypothetical protein
MISSCLKIKENSGREAVIYRDGPVIFHCPESYITCQKKQTRSAMQSSGPKAQVKNENRYVECRFENDTSATCNCQGSFITHGRLSALGQEVDPRCSAIAQGRPARYFKYYPSGSIPREDVRQHWSKCPSYSHGDRLTTRMFAHRSQGRRTFASLPLRHEFGHV